MKLWLVGGITSQISSIRNQFGSKYNSLVASIDELNFETKKIVDKKRHIPPLTVRTEALGRDIRYTSATLIGDKLYACSPTQLYILNAQNFELISEIDHPYFNDVHHINVIQGKIVVANTGLDSVMTFSHSGEFESIHSANSRGVWSNKDATIDYRQIASTKPHANHPNHVFEIEGKIWVTRFHQMDAIELGNPTRRINIQVGKPHDGHVYGEYVYFTTINGFIVIADIKTLKVVERIDLNEIDKRNSPLGWCRSLCIKDGFAMVGFTRLRQTKIESNLRWMREKLTNVKNRLPSRVSKYDLGKRELIDEYIVPKGHTDLIFSIIDPENPL